MPRSTGWRREAPPPWRALAIAGTGPAARVLDAGCGTGADVPALLAAEGVGEVLAMDMIPAFTERLAARIADPRLTVLAGDMTAPPGSFDLIWAMGAAYAPGIDAALSAWRGHLRPCGRVALSDLVWRVAAPSAEARAFWAEDYPEIGDALAFAARIAGAGFRVLGQFWQDAGDWAAYYEPLALRLDEIAPGDPALDEAVAAIRREIALWRAHGDDYGYLLAVVEPA